MIQLLYSAIMTVQAIPGVIEYKGARIQLLDLPGIVEGASQGLSSRLRVNLNH